MQLTTALLAGALATIATACTPDFQSFKISEFDQTYIPFEGTQWKFTGSRPTSGKPFTCEGRLPDERTATLTKGTCNSESQNLTWQAVGYHPDHPTAWTLLIKQVIGPCPPSTVDQTFYFASLPLDKHLSCKDETRYDGARVYTKYCTAAKDIEVTRANYFKDEKNLPHE